MMSVVLALRSILYARYHVFIAALALASTLAPLLFLHGIRTGVIDGLLDQLKKDPGVLAVSIRGHSVLTPADIEELDAMPQVGFVIGNIRSLSSRMEFSSLSDPSTLVPAYLLPSGPGDPVAAPGREIASPEQAVLSESLAAQLDLAIGEAFTATALRADDSELRFELQVLDVRPDTILDEKSALVHPVLLQSLEAFLEGYAIPDQGIDGRDIGDRQTSFSTVRLYAASLEDLVDLDAIMKQRGLRAVSDAQTVIWIRTLDRAMGFVFTVVLGVALVGYLISISASMSSLIRWYEPQLALLRLIGLSDRALIGFPVFFGLCVVMIGIGLSLLAYLGLSTGINLAFSASFIEGNVCTLHPVDVAAACVLSILTVTIVGIRLGYNVARISPALALRG